MATNKSGELDWLSSDDDIWSLQRQPLKPSALQLIKRTIADDPERYAVWVCQATLGIEDAATDNPLLVRVEGKPVPLGPLYEHAAEILLEKLTGVARSARRTIDGYWSIEAWIAHRIEGPRELDLLQVRSYKKGVGRDLLIRDFFRTQIELFEYVAHCALLLVYYGVPLYRIDAEGHLELLPYSHEDYVYLAKKGQYADRVEMEEFPFWTTSYWFNVSHLNDVQRMFHEDAMDLSVEEIAELRGAYRRFIGVEDTAETALTTGKSQRSLLELIPKVLERYYGASYVATDPDTWTKQEAVKDWLMSNFKISEREAAAIDIVTRPDYARRKSR